MYMTNIVAVLLDSYSKVISPHPQVCGDYRLEVVNNMGKGRKYDLEAVVLFE